MENSAKFLKDRRPSTTSSFGAQKAGKKRSPFKIPSNSPLCKFKLFSDKSYMSYLVRTTFSVSMKSLHATLSPS